MEYEWNFFQDKFQPSARFPGSPWPPFFLSGWIRNHHYFLQGKKNHHPKGSPPLLRKQPKNNKKQQRKRQQKNAGCRLPGVKTHRTTTTKKKQVRGFPWKKRSGPRVAQPPSAFGALIALGQHRPWSPRPRPPRRIQGAEIIFALRLRDGSRSIPGVYFGSSLYMGVFLKWWVFPPNHPF